MHLWCVSQVVLRLDFGLTQHPEQAPIGTWLAFRQPSTTSLRGLYADAGIGNTVFMCRSLGGHLCWRWISLMKVEA